MKFSINIPQTTNYLYLTCATFIPALIFLAGGGVLVHVAPTLYIRGLGGFVILGTIVLMVTLFKSIREKQHAIATQEKYGHVIELDIEHAKLRDLRRSDTFMQIDCSYGYDIVQSYGQFLVFVFTITNYEDVFGFSKRFEKPEDQRVAIDLHTLIEYDGFKAALAEMIKKHAPDSAFAKRIS